MELRCSTCRKIFGTIEAFREHLEWVSQRNQFESVQFDEHVSCGIQISVAEPLIDFGGRRDSSSSATSSGGWSSSSPLDDVDEEDELDYTYDIDQHSEEGDAGAGSELGEEADLMMVDAPVAPVCCFFLSIQTHSVLLNVHYFHEALPMFGPLECTWPASLGLKCMLCVVFQCLLRRAM